MKCPHCDAWSDVKETRDGRRRRECANGHRFTTKEVVVVDLPSRDRAIADAVVLQKMTIAEAAKRFGLKSDSYVSRCVRKHYPQFNTRSDGQRRRWARDSQFRGAASRVGI